MTVCIGINVDAPDAIYLAILEQFVAIDGKARLRWVDMTTQFVRFNEDIVQRYLRGYVYESVAFMIPGGERYAECMTVINSLEATAMELGRKTRHISVDDAIGTILGKPKCGRKVPRPHEDWLRKQFIRHVALPRYQNSYNVLAGICAMLLLKEQLENAAQPSSQ